MIIDFHTHIFPDNIAHRAVYNLEFTGREMCIRDRPEALYFRYIGTA